VRIKEEDICKTSVFTRYENYEFMVVPFRLSNAPTSFMCLMNNVLCPYLDKFVIVFVDDILVYSNNEEENLEHLEVVLILLREIQLYGKLKKYSFIQTQIHYLVHVISKEGIEVDSQ